MRHVLAASPDDFTAVWEGRKTHEIRSGRELSVGDTILLREVDIDGETGRSLSATVTFISPRSSLVTSEAVQVASIKVNAKLLAGERRIPGGIDPVAS